MSKVFPLRPIGTVSSARDTPIDDDRDAIPVHIKPVMSGFAPRGDFREPDWSKEIMAGYW